MKFADWWEKQFMSRLCNSQIEHIKSLEKILTILVILSIIGEDKHTIFNENNKQSSTANKP